MNLHNEFINVFYLLSQTTVALATVGNLLAPVPVTVFQCVYLCNSDVLHSRMTGG